MTPRGTDWGLALVVALLFATGMASLFAASPGEAGVFVAHDVLAFALAGLLVVKLRRVWRRLVDPAQWDRLVKPGVLAALFVVAALASGWLWSGGGHISIAGFTLLSWHLVLGWVLTAAVAVHAFIRRRRMRTASRFHCRSRSSSSGVKGCQWPGGESRRASCPISSSAG